MSRHLFVRPPSSSGRKVWLRHRLGSIAFLLLLYHDITGRSSVAGFLLVPIRKAPSHQGRISNRFAPCRRSSCSFLPVAASDKDVSSSVNEKKLLLRDELKEAFVDQITTSIQEGTFVSLVLRGPSSSSSSKKKNNKAQLVDGEALRGCVKQIHGRRIQLKGREFLQVTFKYHSATDIAKNWPLQGSKSDHRMIHDAFLEILDLRDTPLNGGNSNNNNYIPASEWGDNVLEDRDLAHMLGIQRGILTTSQHTVELDVGFTAKKPRLKRAKLKAPTSDTNSNAPSTAVVEDHDRSKQVPLNSQSAFLQALGVTDTQGKPKRAMASKLRQCQKFVEIVGNLVEKCSGANNQQQSDCVSVLDMGCGRGYLTFSLHSYLVSKFGKETAVKSIGIDMRPKLVREVNDIARSLGLDFDGLVFQEGSIESSMVTAASSENDNHNNSLDILIALHACDTATDDALWCGISRGANIIVVAPCCHKQVRPQLDALLARTDNNKKQPHPLADILRHNVYRERHAETVTDSLRALLLEAAGYQVQVFEFIGGEHTAKNVMITAIRKPNVPRRNTTAESSILNRIDELASLHGITEQKLARWMGPSYSGKTSLLLGSQTLEGSTTNFHQKRVQNAKNMPPL
ncbi:Inherit from COG: Methyltransferase [Seminavis robusta]|uniref:Inherit from COG: Methyltransferase n=1 Tax=Seminavis robusta TaxID=568900 RepID=A0A9N8DR25_9STRA|nr:Inherit from COG: Methyltransferase [Seminavis robusta]|eukprot:Sro278_g106460.1 Inherit from COG: Methyltransferase (628) ;mRNA; r:3155-5038